jgi:hypothetical protein
MALYPDRRRKRRPLGGRRHYDLRRRWWRRIPGVYSLEQWARNEICKRRLRAEMREEAWTS